MQLRNEQESTFGGTIYFAVAGTHTHSHLSIIANSHTYKNKNIPLNTAINLQSKMTVESQE